MIHAFEGETADDVWRIAADRLITGEVDCQDSRLGPTRELLHVHFCIRDPRQRWVYSRQPAMNPAFAIAEAFWILSGRHDASFLNFWNPALPRFAGTEATYYGAYGHRIRHTAGIDQLERAYQVLRENPNSRQVVVQIWDARLDMPLSNGAPRNADIPCNIVCVPKVRDGRLEWLQILRSNDLIRGMPYNIVQFTILQEVFSGWLGLSPGEYHQVSDSLHMYIHDMESFHIQPSTIVGHNHESLALPKEESTEVLASVGIVLDALVAKRLNRSELPNLCLDPGLPESYRNLLLIASADSARRRGWLEEMDAAEAMCTNSALLMAWDAWKGRKNT